MKFSKLIKIFFLILVLVIPYTTQIFAQTTNASAPVGNSGWSDIPLQTYLLLSIILLELIIIVFLANSWLMAMGYQKKVQKKLSTPNKEAATQPTFFQRINNTVDLEHEHEIDLNHNYDGISELDNKTPRWWSFAFYGTIAFGLIYLYRMYGNESMPGQVEELATEYKMAEIQKSRYLATTTANIDEKNVTMLSQDEIMKGAMTFKANCIACHGSNGEGNAVGPNLTDEYWIHKGSIKDIFTTIKYGWPEKGMKSWKDDFSPEQIAQLASYVKSLKGTNPPNAKAKQGDLYLEEPSKADSTMAK